MEFGLVLADKVVKGGLSHRKEFSNTSMFFFISIELSRFFEKRQKCF